MPAIPNWHKRIPSIRTAVEASDAPFLDRLAIEKLFRLKSRSVQMFMKECGGTLIGRSVVVSRGELLERLDEIEASLPPQAKERRKGILVELEAAIAVQAVVPEIPRPNPSSTALPAGVILEMHGKLVIEYASAADLLSKVFAVTQAAQKDIVGFRATVEVPS